MNEDAQRALKELKEYDGHKLSVCVAKKKIHDKRKTGVYVCLKSCIRELMHCFYLITVLMIMLWTFFHSAPKATAGAPKGNEQKSTGFRKKTLKARLIIRNLSFQVQLRQDSEPQFDLSCENSCST